MLTVTPEAIEKLKEFVSEQKDDNSSVRVVAAPGENGGVQYMMTMDKDLKEDDTFVEMDGFKLYVDSTSEPYLEEATIDYVEELSRVGFTITNPKFSHGCACGGGGGGGCGDSCGCGGH